MGLDFGDPSPSNQQIRRHPRQRLRLLAVLVIPQQPTLLGLRLMAQARLAAIKNSHVPSGPICLRAPAQGLGRCQQLRPGHPIELNWRSRSGRIDWFQQLYLERQAGQLWKEVDVSWWRSG